MPCFALLLPVINSRRFFSEQRMAMLCIVVCECVRVFTLKWIEHLTYTTRISRVTITLFRHVNHIPFRSSAGSSFFSTFYPFIPLYVCIQSRQFIPMFQFKGDLLFGMLVDCVVYDIVCLCICNQIVQSLDVHGCLCVMCVYLPRSKSLGLKYDRRIYNAIIEGAVSFGTFSAWKNNVAKGAMPLFHSWLCYSRTIPGRTGSYPSIFSVRHLLYFMNTAHTHSHSSCKGWKCHCKIMEIKF